MPRSLRIEFEGAWYHVMNRGLNKQNIFYTQEHRHLFLNLLENVSKKFLIEIHGYCLMDNHYHLLIHTPLANLAKTMQYLDGVYTQRFNRSVRRDGPLFRGRYKAILIDEENYLLQVSRYIHMNPVSAKICSFPEHYHWSSYQYYLGNKQEIPWLHSKYVLNLINEKNPNEAYKVFTDKGLDLEMELFYNKNHPAPILGCNEFIAEHLKNLDLKYQIEVSTDIKKTRCLVDPKIIFLAIEKYFQIDSGNLKISTPGKKNHPRMAAIYLLKILSHWPHQKIADSITNIKSKAISAILARCECWLKQSESFKQDIINLRRLIVNLEDDVI